MSENNNKQQQPRVVPSDVATPFFTLQQLWRTEAQRVLEETTSAVERGFGEWERAVAETQRYTAAQAKAVHEASRAFLAGTRTMIG